MAKRPWKHYLLVIVASGEKRKLPSYYDRMAIDLACRRLAEEKVEAGYDVVAEDYMATDWTDDCVSLSYNGEPVAMLYRGDKGQWSHAKK